MKKVLSLLVIFVVLNVHSWAYAPDYPVTAASVSGTYAGVLIPTNEVTTTAASIGVFAVGIPSTTSGTPFSGGAAVLFSSGAAYPSLINGVFDPQSSTLTAIVEGSATVSQTNNVATGTTNPITGQPETTVTTTQSEIFAQGSLVATIQQASQVKSLSAAGNGGPGTAGAQRIAGTASVDLFSSTSATGSPNISSTVNFTVNGFQQTSVYSVPAITITVPNASAGSASGS